ncbi:MAG: hypothetical protein AABX93_00230 [Nanoarchaeota archaeon]
MKDKRGNLLTENIIFIILTLIFFSILILFISSRTGGASLMEEELAKQIALVIDSSKPRTIVKINVEDALAKAKKENYQKSIISVTGNTITVKLREKGGYSYSFFNNVDVSIFPDTSSLEIKDYVITINGYK